MMRRVCVIIALVCVVAVVQSQEASKEDFARWVDKYNKVYDPLEIVDKFDVFRKNAKTIAMLNDMHDGVEYELNEFADMSPELFAKNILMPPRKAPLRENEDVSVLSDSIPTSWDWRDKNAVTPVKNQGSVGSCWSFSTTGNVEGQWFLAGNKLVSLSEEQLVECDANDCGVFGGWPKNAMQYIVSSGGIQGEDSYPYCCGTGNCYPCMANKNTTFCGPAPTYCNRTCQADPSKVAAKISSFVTISQDEDQIAQQLYKRGPLSVLLNASMLQWYRKGVYSPRFCDPTSLDHAVLLVGYGTDQATGKDYWLVKNSWGAKWGENGYFRILRGAGKCGINAQVVSAVV